MFHRYFAVFPLLASLAAAQADHQVVVSEPGFIAEAYGLGFVGTGWMTSTLDVESTDAGRFLHIKAPNGMLALFIGAGEDKLPLAPLGFDAWLLVDPIFASVAVPMHDPIVLPQGPHLIGNDFYLQSVALMLDESTGEFAMSFSHGMRLSFFAP